MLCRYIITCKDDNRCATLRISLYTLSMNSREPFISGCTNPLSLLVDECVQVQVSSVILDMWFQHLWTNILRVTIPSGKENRQIRDCHLSSLPFKILNLVLKGDTLEGGSHGSKMRTRDLRYQVYKPWREEWSGSASQIHNSHAINILWTCLVIHHS